MFEHKSENLLPRRLFAKRMAVFAGIAVVLVQLALLIGIAGYHWIAGLDIVDSILNASMILAGMGPVNELHSIRAKLFASGYAIFSGIVFISLMGLLLAPVIHRILHKFHVDEDEDRGHANKSGRHDG